MKTFSRVATLAVAVVVLASRATAQCGGSGDVLTSDRMCGPVAVQAILRHFGQHVDLDELKQQLSSTDGSAGASMYTLCSAVTSRGLYAKAVKISTAELLSLSLPFIAHYCFNHYVAIEPGPNGCYKFTYDKEGTSRTFPKGEFPRQNFDGLFTGLALVVSDDPKKLPQSTASGPDMRVDEYVWDHGATERGVALRHVFRIRNAGSDVLVLGEIVPSCACLTVAASTSRLPPGDACELQVLFDGNMKGLHQERIRIKSNDPVVPLATLIVQGFVKPDLLLPSPVRVEFPRPVEHGTVAEQKVFVPQYPDGSIKITSVSPDPFFDVSWVRVDDDKRSQGYDVVFSLRPDAPPGYLKRRLTLQTTHHRQKSIDVIVEARILGNVRTDTDQFFLGLLKKGETAKSAVTISTVAKDPLKIERVESSLTCVSVEVAPKTEGKEYILTATLNLTATLKPDAPLGNIKGEITIHTNDPDQPRIKVPVYAYVEQ